MFFRDLGPHNVLFTVYGVHDLFIRRIKLWCLKWVTFYIWGRYRFLMTAVAVKS